MKRKINIALAGFFAGLAMQVVIFLAIHILKIAPINVHPAQAFLYNLGIESITYALLLHFSYAILWSFVLVYAFDDEVTIKKAVVLGIILWIFMMIVYSPLIGWGIFGLGYAIYLPAEHPLFITNILWFIIVALALHLIYGLVLGYLNNRWITANSQNIVSPR